MSDYISKSELLDAIEKRQFINKAIEKVFKEIIEEQPTLDEKEIIRKPFERVVERLEDKKWGTSEWRDKWRDEIIGECIGVVKEEGGIE